jgi:hypothetical protein
VIVLTFGDDDEGVGAVARDTNEAAAGQRTEQGHAPICVLGAISAMSQPSCYPFH